MKLCLIGLLFIVLLYCCLGTRSLEGLTSGQPNLGPGGIYQGGGNNNDYDPAKEVAQAGREHQQESLNQYERTLNNEGLGCSEYDENGYCVENNAKNKNSYPGDYSSKKKCDDAGFIWNSALKKCEKNYPGKQGAGTYKYGTQSECEDAGFMWNSSKQTCDEDYPGKDGGGTNQNDGQNCPQNMKWSEDENMCIHQCPEGMRWSHKKKKCVKKKNKTDNNETDDEDDDSGSWEDRFSKEWGQMKDKLNDFFNSNGNGNGNGNNLEKHYSTDPKTGESQLAASYPSWAMKRRDEIKPGDENLYILKSQIVPPVCPACPPVIEGGGCPAACKAKCAPCPRPPPIPPCPPCERCPEPQFKCKKVPDYRNILPGNLPRPLLNDFSQFT